MVKRYMPEGYLEEDANGDLVKFADYEAAVNKWQPI
jgi:hypothetical protein